MKIALFECGGIWFAVDEAGATGVRNGLGCGKCKVEKLDAVPVPAVLFPLSVCAEEIEI